MVVEKQSTYPVIEIFGPTIQGEGFMVGTKAVFVRFGGCDFRCEWCDTPYAVYPVLVRDNKQMLTAEQIVTQVNKKASHVSWVILTGGNPVIHKNMGRLIVLLQYAGYNVAVETQGSVWHDWLLQCEAVTVSPKGPTAGVYCQNFDDVRAFLNKLVPMTRSVMRDRPDPLVCVKPVIFNNDDYIWARRLYTQLTGWKQNSREYLHYYFQVGTSKNDNTSRTLARTRWLVEKVCNDPTLSNVRVLPQMHVLIWGRKQGV